MTMQFAFTTLLGGAVFGFLCNFVWGKLVDNFGPIGGWVAAGVVVGTTWALNHSVNLIHQSGQVWIDMGLAALVGGLVCSTMNGGKLSKSMPTLVGIVIGAVIAGTALSIIL